MANGAFTGGVKPGGLTSTTEVRNLLCYVIRRVSPLSREALENALVGEELVNYFELVGCLDDLIERGLVTEQNDMYAITPSGEAVADTLYRDLPRTVRESAIHAVMQIRSWSHRAASNRATVQEKDGKYSVVCTIGDMGSDVFRMELAMPDKLTAEMIKNNFIAHGSDIFPKLLNALTQPGSEDDRPPATLQ